MIGAVEEVDDKQSDAYWRSRPPGARRSAVASLQSEVVISRAVNSGWLTWPRRSPPNRGRPVLLDGVGTGSVLRVSNFGKKELTVSDRLRYQADSGNWRIERLSP